MQVAKSIPRRSWIAIVMLAAVIAMPEVAVGHEKAVLRSAVSAVAAGDTLPLSGADFSAGESYALRLLGALREYDLQRIEVGSEGSFDLALPIPSNVVPGVYKLTAVAADGDLVAGLDVTVLRPRLSGTDGEPSDDTAASQSGMRDVARADEMPIERTRSGVEWGIIGLAIGLAAGVGIMLMRRS